MIIDGAVAIGLLLEDTAEGELLIGISNSCPPATVPPWLGVTAPVLLLLLLLFCDASLVGYAVVITCYA